MFPIPPDETLVETKACKHCGVTFPITDKDMEFYAKVSPVFNGKKYSIPTPKLCPDCRQQRRLSFRNERKLYKRKCNATGENIISIYSPDKPYIVYNQDFWWSDKWNPMDYEREFDFERGFFEQFGELFQEVPKVAIINKSSDNSEYTHISAFNKNGYLLIESSNNEDSLYGYWLQKWKKNIDCSFLSSCENCYFTIDSESCYWLILSQNCKSCSDGIFLKDCINSKHCIACVWIQGKEYMILNKQSTKEEYEDIRSRIFKDRETLFSIEENYWKLKKTIPYKYSEIQNSEESIGWYITHASNIKKSFEVHDAKNIAYSSHVWFNSGDCYDVDTVWLDSSFIYESINTAVNSMGDSFCNRCWTVSYSTFSIDCDNSSHLFWCIWLRNKQYCILNRQYTKEEYEELVPKIIEHMITTGEWGEFFPSSLSPFGYNETVAQEYFPMSREEILNGHPELVSGSASVSGQKEYAEISSAWRDSSLRGVEWNETTKQSSVPMVSVSRSSGTSGSPHFVRDDDIKEDSDTFLHWSIFNWSDYEPPFPKVDKIIPARKLPEDISSIPDDILNWAIECEVTGKPFRIIPQELEFYRKHHLPIPRRHPDQRHLNRMKMRNPRKLYERVCDCPECEINNKTSLSSFSPNENPFGTIERDSPMENDKETVDTFVLNPRTRKRGKKMITTYSPDRKELVFCENCYNTTVLS